MVGRLVEDIQSRRITLRSSNLKFMDRRGRSQHFTHADKSKSRSLHPDPIAGVQQLQGVAVPRPTTSADEVVLARLVPRPAHAVSERSIELTIPWLTVPRPSGAGRSR